MLKIISIKKLFLLYQTEKNIGNSTILNLQKNILQMSQNSSFLIPHHYHLGMCVLKPSESICGLSVPL